MLPSSGGWRKIEKSLRLVARHSWYESFVQVLKLVMSHLFPFNLKTEVDPASVLFIIRRVRVVVRSAH
jgi:hypothetical protein